MGHGGSCAGTYGFDIQVCPSGQEAVRGADIITTCTADKTHAILLYSADVSPGVRINAPGGDCPGKTELDPEILRRGTVFVESEPQTRIEGEIQALPGTFPVTPLWKVLAGEAEGRTAENEITVFDSVGFAIEDYSALLYLYESVSGGPLCEEIDLVADPDDPKDLFGFALAASPVSQAATGDPAVTVRQASGLACAGSPMWPHLGEC
ncbi:hypothetical protein [Streptomyces rapamycinicus]|uniref:hypothetical protein n=1 Tax=Streptomyces rapamycinicus TaxID=1226757 RepID=UPI0023E2F598|nr:hypothetical protein [Streptomyces rapamycinicus]